MASQEQLNRQKEALKLEKEYQDSLRFSKSVLGDINKAIDDSIDGRTKLGQLISDYNKTLKSNLSEVRDSSDVAQQIVDIEAENSRLQRGKNQHNKKANDLKIKNNNLALEGLKGEYDRLKAGERLDDIGKGITSTINDQVDALQSFGSNIPIIGGLFDSVFGGAFDELKASVGQAAQSMVTNFMKGGASFKSFGAAASTAGKSIMAAFANPMVLIGVAIAAAVAVIATAIAAFTKIDAAAKKFREETGLLNSNTAQTAANITRVTKNTKELGASYEDVAQAAADFANEQRGLAQPSKAVLQSVVVLNKNFGIATSEAAKVNGIFQDISGASAEAAAFLTAQTVELANQVGVAPSQVIADIAENAETAAIFFGGSARELASAAIEAAALGTSLTEAAKVSEGLLDFENSINAELEASAMLGQSINFNKARELAANNDIIGAQQAVLNQLEDTVDLNNLNRFQLDSISKASGIEVGELRKQLRLRERFRGLDGERLRAAQQVLESGKDLSDITTADIELQTARNKQQQELQSLTDELGNTFGAIGSSILDALAPVGKIILQLLNLAGKFLLPIFKLIGSVIGGVFSVISAIVTVIYNVLSSVMDFFMPIADFISGIFSSIGSFFTGATQNVGNFSTTAAGATPMATGGIVTGPTNAIIGEAGPEAVIPLGGDVMGSGAIVSAIEKLGSDIRQLQFQMNIDGRAVADAVTKVNQRSTANDFAISV